MHNYIDIDLKRTYIVIAHYGCKLHMYNIFIIVSMNTQCQASIKAIPFEVVFGSSEPVSDLTVINEEKGDKKLIYDSDGDNSDQHIDNKFEDDGGHGDDDNDDNNDDDEHELGDDNNAKMIDDNSPDPTSKNSDEFNSVPGK